jgi:hypothetical protein
VSHSVSLATVTAIPSGGESPTRSGSAEGETGAFTVLFAASAGPFAMPAQPVAAQPRDQGVGGRGGASLMQRAVDTGLTGLEASFSLESTAPAEHPGVRSEAEFESAGTTLSGIVPWSEMRGATPPLLAGVALSGSAPMSEPPPDTVPVVGNVTTKPETLATPQPAPPSRAPNAAQPFRLAGAASLDPRANAEQRGTASTERRSGALESSIAAAQRF